jgi:hypothetical protein
MSINISNFPATYPIRRWCTNPGKEMAMQAEIEGKDQKLVEKIFSQFVKNKIPHVKNLLDRLIRINVLSEVHFPMKLANIFFLYLHDQVEHYQNQLYQRDISIDQTLQNIKCTFANESDRVFLENPKWLYAYTQELKTKLSQADILSPNFDLTLDLWQQILSIAHIGKMELAAFYDKNVQGNCIDYENKLNVNKSLVYINSSRDIVTKSFYLVLSQLSKDFNWIAQRMFQNLQPNGDEQVELAFKVYVEANEEQAAQTVFVQYQAYENEMKYCLNSLSSLNLEDDKSIELIRDRMIKTLNRIFNSIIVSNMEKDKNTAKKMNDETRMIFKSSVTDQKVFLGKKLVSQLFPRLQCYVECSQLKQTYFDHSIDKLSECLISFLDSNNDWREFIKTKKMPKLTDKISIFPVFPITPSRPQNEIEQELLEGFDWSTESTQKGNQQRKGKAQQNPPPSKRAQKNQKSTPPPKGANKKPAAPPPPPKKAAVTPPSNLTPIPVAPINPCDRLAEKLTKLYEANPSQLPLRQALWHLDALMTIQHSPKKSPLTADDCLNRIDLTASSAQKLLEQVYRFFLEKNGIFLSNHNLKEYHRSLDPNFTAYPAVVKSLFLANHWTRHFYSHHEKWHSLTTHTVSAPPLLDLLVEVAEGRILSAAQLEKQISEMIEQACLQVESLLQEVETPVSPLFAAPEEGPIALKENVKLGTFNAVKAELEGFLIDSHLSPHHPVYLHQKQALSALRMLETSLQQINTAKNLQELTTWTTWSLQQLQETIEDVLHGIEFFRDGAVSSEHELRTLSERVGLDMGALGHACERLSYKPRYPVEIPANGTAAQIIDDAAALRHYPGFLDGFGFQSQQNHPVMFWKMPSENASPDNIVTRLAQLIADSEEFLRTQAIPALRSSV